MSKVVCVTGSRFSPEQEAFLWAHARARGYGSGVWVPGELARRMGIRRIGHAAPLELCAENGRRLFYHVSQLSCSQDDVEKYLQARKEEEAQAGREMVKSVDGGKKKSAEFLVGVDDNGDDDAPLNTNGEPFPDCFAQVMRKTCGKGSRYWATEAEASYIFGSPFHPSFLRPENAVVLPGNELSNRLVYYNVCGTERADFFNSKTCVRYEPINIYGRPYTQTLAVMMKRCAIRHDCIGSNIWITTRRLARAGFPISTNVQPLNIFVNGELLKFVNLDMTKNIKAIHHFAMSRPYVNPNHNVDGTE